MKTPEYMRNVNLENIRKVCPEARKVDITLGDDATGDPAAYLTVWLDDSVIDDRIIRGEFKPLEDWLMAEIWHGSDHQRWPYLRLYRLREEQELAVRE